MRIHCSLAATALAGRGIRQVLRPLLVLLLLLLPATDAAGDLLIYGKFDYYYVPLNAKEIGFITTKCYSGLLFSTCRPALQSDDFAKNENLPYYNKLVDMYGVQYCAQCCGTAWNNEDIWDLRCDMDIQTASTSNVYGYELRLAAHQQPQTRGDTEIVTCPLKRSACQYSADGKTTLNCDGQANDKTYLIGYTLTLTIQQYDQNFFYWRGIADCSIESIESDTQLQPGEVFHEKIIFVHVPNIMYSKPDAPKIILSLFAVYVIAYAMLYYFRRKRCVFCQGKLVLSKEMCYKCKFVGAKPPDPFLMQALEEKGEQLQQSELLPDRLPGSRVCVRRLVQWWEALGLGGGGGAKVGEAGEGTDPTAAPAETGAAPAAGGAPAAAKFKYPSWLKWFKRWRARRLKRLAEDAVNPNLLTQPRFVIFRAVGHHDPPDMDEAAVAARKSQITEALGFNPEDYVDDESGAQGGESKLDSSSLRSKPVPEWQKQYQKRLAPGVADVPTVSLWMQWKMRRGFVKQRNKSYPIQWRYVFPFVGAIVALIIVLAVGAAIVTGAVNFSDPTAVPSKPEAQAPSAPSA